MVQSSVLILSSNHDDSFSEQLLIKPLATGEVYAQFKFIVEKDVQPSTFKHFRLFPRLLGEIISKNSVHELHFSLTRGLWRYEKWGYPYRDAPPGAELWAWFHNGTTDINKKWGNLVNALSGQFCASLNFIKDENTISPRYSFRPQGAVIADDSYNSSYVRYSTLPAEIVCTENLTPFKKLLPCDTKAGISTLLNAISLFNAHFVSLALDVRTLCKSPDCSKKSIELVQSVSVVQNPAIQQQGKQDWSFMKLFGCGLSATCPVASRSLLYIDISLNKTGIPFVLKPEPTEQYTKRIKEGGSEFIVYDLQEEVQKYRPFSVVATYKSQHIYWLIPPPVVYANRRVTGFGQERGGIQCTLYNNHPTQSLKLWYMDVIPWYLRLYLHTLEIKSGNTIIEPDFVYYDPGQNHERPSHLEMFLTVPPKSRTEISMEFDYVFLKRTEYPPDPNHGFTVGPAVISTVVPSNANFTIIPGQTSNSYMPQLEDYYLLRIHTGVLLVSLPTPDFSMPYNVICLSCTVVALAFGPIHNITTKSLKPVDEAEEGFVKKLKKYITSWWKKGGKCKEQRKAKTR